MHGAGLTAVLLFTVLPFTVLPRRDEPRELEGFPTLPVPESERRKGSKIGGGGFKNGAPKSEKDEIKDPKVEQEIQKYVGARL